MKRGCIITAPKLLIEKEASRTIFITDDNKRFKEDRKANYWIGSDAVNNSRRKENEDTFQLKILNGV